MTASKQSIVIGVFEDRAAAVQAIDALLKAGFQENQLGFVARQESAGILFQREEFKGSTSSPNAIVRGIVGGLMGAIDLLLAPITGPSDASNMLATALPATEEVIDRMTHSGMHSKQLLPVPNGQAASSEEMSQQQEIDQAHQERTSVITGGVIGGAVGTAAAALLLPEIGPVVAGGLLATLLSGAILGGMAGGFLGTFANIGVPNTKIKYYKQEMKARKTLVTVQTADRQGEAMEILSHYAAHDIATYSHHGPVTSQ
jgi:hypothetical protein